MMVFWDQRLVFLATPKTGSTAIETALEGLASFSLLRPRAARHTDARQYRRYLAPYLASAAGAEFTAVALMREPLDWLGSWYRSQEEDAVEEVDFDRFVRDHLADPPPAHADVGSQGRFLGHPDRAVDRIFAYEDIDRFVAFLEDRLDCEITLPRVNVSRERPLDVDPETVARHRAHAVEDYALWERLRGG